MYGKESGEVRTQQMNYLDGLRRFRDKGVSVLVDGMNVWKKNGAAFLKRERTEVSTWGILSAQNRAA